MRGVLLRVLAIGSLICAGGIGGCLSGDTSAGRRCSTDAVCNGDEVCARDNRCYLASTVRSVHVSWTVDGLPPSLDACSDFPDLRITFWSDSRDPNDDLRFAPVPCEAGKYTIDKLPRSFGMVTLETPGRIGTNAGDSANLDGSGEVEVALDLRHPRSGS